MMSKEVQDHEFTEATSLDGRRETPDSGRGSEYRQRSKRGVPAIRDRDRSILCVGEACPTGRSGGTAEWEAWKEEDKTGSGATDRDGETSGSGSRTEHGEPETKKGVVGIVAYRHYSKEEKELILGAVGEVQEIVRAPMKAILEHMGIPRATYYRWLKRASEDCLVDRTVTSQRRAWPPTPQEIYSVCGYALEAAYVADAG